MKFSQLRELDKKTRIVTEELNEHLQDVAKKLFRDQEEWLDSCMKDLLRPDIYEKARADDCQQEVADYISRRKIKITFIPDSCRIRIDVAGQQYAEFCPKFQFEDGQPIELTPNMFGQNNPEPFDSGLN